jgi:hypothetical protein
MYALKKPLAEVMAMTPQMKSFFAEILKVLNEE